MDRTAVSGTAGTGSIPVGGAMFTANTLTTYSTRSVCVSPFGSVCRSQNKLVRKSARRGVVWRYLRFHDGDRDDS